jgi:PAS domain-containing protein
VAALAGIGIDWYIRLEQGRCVSPSLTTIDALARALRLSAVEHQHLRALANHERAVFVRETVPEALRLTLDGLRQPAYVLGRRWDVLAWNRAAEQLFGFGRAREEDRNVLIFLLTAPAARRLFDTGWADQARRVVAQFRASHDLSAGDPAFMDLLKRLRAGCPEFGTWWKGHEIRSPAAGTKLMKHPTKGLLRVTHASFQSNDDPNLRLVIFSYA